MDIFIEEIVKKKKRPLRFLTSLGAILLGIILIIIILALGVNFIQFLPSVLMIAIIAVGYGIYYVITSDNVEFEYSLVNSDIDIDKIINRKKRKHLYTISLYNLEAFGTRNHPDFEGFLKNPLAKKVYACHDKKAKDIFYLVFNQGSTKTMLFINPSEKIIQQIAKRNPKTPLI